MLTKPTPKDLPVKESRLECKLVYGCFWSHILTISVVSKPSFDTGIDYTHPALGGGFGAGFKVAGGYDFVGDNYDGSNTPVPDPDPLSQ